jgi:hypothetical protein
VYNHATRRLVSNRNVIFDEGVLPSMGESCLVLEGQRIDEDDNTPDSQTLCREEPETSLGEPQPQGTKELQHSESVEDTRDVNLGETALAPRPMYNRRSTAPSK